MKVYHQVGHIHKWNLDSFVKDGCGDGLIFSPVNIESDKLTKINERVRNKSFIDPQFYLLKEVKSKLSTYNFFPANLVDNIQTQDLSDISDKVAVECIEYQINNNFQYITIPTRYFEHFPSDYYDQLNEGFIYPFTNYYSKSSYEKEFLLTVIVKQEQLIDEEKRDYLLNWITGITEINGVYLIFDNNFHTKQIKDAQYLFNALIFINTLKLSGLKVIIGYTNTEGILYSIANPDAISMGSYENLRKFDASRFQIKINHKQNPPNPRLYSGKLFQWIEYGYIEPMKHLYDKWDHIFEESEYKPVMFEPEFNWHFQKPELYKHYYCVFSKQVNTLPDEIEKRIKYLEESFNTAINIFNDIKNCGIYLDDNSDGSHLNIWMTVISMFKKYLRSI